MALTTNLTKEDTRALWHAVEGLHDLVRAMYGENFSAAQLAAERAKVLAARRALRKVNAIRKGQVATISKIVAKDVLQSPACWCESCDAAANSGLRSRMSLCPQCGTKRCPRATHHDNACTGSNEPGQPGSSWENCRPSEELQAERKAAGAPS